MPQNSTLMQLRQQTLGVDNEDMPNSVNRYFGGHRRRNHPLISGYWYLIMVPPEKLFGDKTERAIQWFHTSAESFTPPTRTINKVDVPGMGGQASSFMAGQELTRTFTVAFREYRDAPIMQLMNLWTSAIDPHFGLSPLSGTDWIASSYKGYAFAIYAKPTGNAIMESYDGSNVKSISADDIEQVYFFEGVFPEAPPFDTMNNDISTSDGVQHSVTFSFDGFPLTKEHTGVVEKAIEEWETNISSVTHKNTLDVEAKADNSHTAHAPWESAGDAGVIG